MTDVSFSPFHIDLSPPYKNSLSQLQDEQHELECPEQYWIVRDSLIDLMETGYVGTPYDIIPSLFSLLRLAKQLGITVLGGETTYEDDYELGIVRVYEEEKDVKISFLHVPRGEKNTLGHLGHLHVFSLWGYKGLDPLRPLDKVNENVEVVGRK